MSKRSTGKMNWKPVIHPVEGQEKFRAGSFLAIRSQDDQGRWHLSVSHFSRLPKYGELKQARYDLLPPDIWMVMVFPPPIYFVNIHPRCLHLWEIEQDERWTQGTI